MLAFKIAQTTHVLVFFLQTIIIIISSLTSTHGLLAMAACVTAYHS